MGGTPSQDPHSLVQTGVSLDMSREEAASSPTLVEHEAGNGSSIATGGTPSQGPQALVQADESLVKVGEEVGEKASSPPKPLPPLVRLAKLLQEAPARTSAHASAIASAAVSAASDNAARASAIASAAAARASDNKLTVGLLVGFLLLLLVGVGIAGSMLFVDQNPPLNSRSTASRVSSAAPLVEETSRLPSHGRKSLFAAGEERRGGRSAARLSTWQSARSRASVFFFGEISDASSSSSPSPSPPPARIPDCLASAVKPPSQFSLRTTFPYLLRHLEQFAQMRFAQPAVTPSPSSGKHSAAAMRRAQISSLVGFEDLTVPEGVELLLAVPSLVQVREAIGARGAALDYFIADDSGRRVLGVAVERAPESVGASGGVVMERISLVDYETRQPHGHFELCLPSSSGVDIELQAMILSADGAQRSRVSEARNFRGHRAVVVGTPGGCATHLVVQAHDAAAKAATISSPDRLFAASVDLGGGSQPGGGAEFNWLRVAPGVNVGLVILALLAMDRIQPAAVEPSPGPSGRQSYSPSSSSSLASSSRGMP